MFFAEIIKFSFLAALSIQIIATPTNNLQKPNNAKLIVQDSHQNPQAISKDPKYPDTLIYTSEHTYFSPDAAFRGFRLGATSYAITHYLNNEIDGAAVLPDKNESIIAGQMVGKLFGVGEDESFAITAPFAAVFVTANLDLDLSGMVEDPYGGHGHLAIIDGVPKEPIDGSRWMNSTEYAKFVKELEYDS